MVLYTLATYKGSLSYSGTSLDLDVGGTYNVYHKYNGSGVWAVVMKRDTDNIHNNGSTGEGNGQWLAVLTTTDPTNISADYNNFIPNYQSVDYDMITSSSEQDDNGNGTVSSSSSQVAYASGNTPAGLIFQNDKLAIDFAPNLAAAASTNTLPASVVATAISEAEARASQAQNTTFSNAVAQLPNNPNNTQSALEASKVAIDAVSTTVSANQATASTEYGHIDDLQAALGTTSDDMGSIHSTLTSDVSARANIAELAVLVKALRDDAVATVGVGMGSGIATAGDNVTATDVEGAISDLDVALGLVQGDLTSRIPAVDQYHNAVQYPLTSDQLAGVTPVDAAQYDQVDLVSGTSISWSTDMSGFVTDVRILVDFGSVGDVHAGIYDRDHTTGLLTRSEYFNEASEIQKNAIFQVRYGGAIAGAEFMVVTPDEPSVGSDPIGFENISAVIIGQGTIAKDRLRPELQTELDDKNVKVIVEDTVGSGVADLSAGVGKVISHTLGRCMVSVVDASGNDISAQVEIDHNVPTFNQVTITSGDNYNNVFITLFG